MWSFPTIWRSFRAWETMAFPRVFVAKKSGLQRCQDFPWLCHVLCTAEADDRWTGVVRTAFYDTPPTPSCQCCYNEVIGSRSTPVFLGAGLGAGLDGHFSSENNIVWQGFYHGFRWNQSFKTGSWNLLEGKVPEPPWNPHTSLEKPCRSFDEASQGLYVFVCSILPKKIQNWLVQSINISLGWVGITT